MAARSAPASYLGLQPALWVFVAYFTLSSFVLGAAAWENEDFELFDLVEDVQLNFYEVLGVDRAASASEIRKAYRKQSLLLHPDKNKEEDAEEKFRKLVAVTEVLKDTDMRQRYDHILEHGLPDWRQPVFYYRRVRKMGLLELAVLLFIILTVGHYIVLWSIYWERLLELESVLPKKRKEKRAKKGSRQVATPAADPDLTPVAGSEVAAVEDPLRPATPSLTDALPCKLYRGLWAAALATPAAMATLGREAGLWLERRRQAAEVVGEEEGEEEWEEEGEAGRERVRRRRRPDPALVEYQPSSGAPVTYTLQNTVQTDTDKASQHMKSGDWSAEEVSRLIRTMTKYPGGTSARWERIAEEIARPVDQVTKKAKQIKAGGFVVNVEAGAQGITGAVKHAVSSKTGRTFTDDIITTTTSSTDLPSSEEPSEPRRRPRTAKAAKTADRTLLGGQRRPPPTEEEAAVSREEVVEGETGSWSQRQQTILEKALSVYPKGVAERWERIAEAVPGKTKEQCLLRYKDLVEAIRKKKQLSTEQPFRS